MSVIDSVKDFFSSKVKLYGTLAILVLIAVQSARASYYHDEYVTKKAELKAVSAELVLANLYSEQLVAASRRRMADYEATATTANHARKEIANATEIERKTPCPVLSRTLSILQRRQAANRQ